MHECWRGTRKRYGGSGRGAEEMEHDKEMIRANLRKVSNNPEKVIDDRIISRILHCPVINMPPMMTL